MKRYADAAEVLLACVISEEAAERKMRAVRANGAKASLPAGSARRAAEYFLLALATAGTGDSERAKVWFSWEMMTTWRNR